MSLLISTFIKGFIIGLSITAPVGPIGILCIKRTLTAGLFLGIVSGLGAAVADAIYGLIAGLGLTSISNFLVSCNLYTSILGVFFLGYLGIKTIVDRPVVGDQMALTDFGILNAFMSTFVLTVTNPITILSFLGIISGLGVDICCSTVGVFIFVVGVLVGSITWWIALCGFVSIFRSNINTKIMRLINVISGIILISFAFYITLKIIYNPQNLFFVKSTIEKSNQNRLDQKVANHKREKTSS